MINKGILYLHNRFVIFTPRRAVVLASTVITRQRIVHCKKDLVKQRLPVEDNNVMPYKNNVLVQHTLC